MLWQKNLPKTFPSVVEGVRSILAVGKQEKGAPDFNDRVYD
jgi:hypothetical protein